jgi:hypothetical protein
MYHIPEYVPNVPGIFAVKCTFKPGLQMIYHFVIWNMTFCSEKGYTLVIFIPRLYHFETVYTT